MILRFYIFLDENIYLFINRKKVLLVQEKFNYNFNINKKKLQKDAKRKNEKR